MKLRSRNPKATVVGLIGFAGGGVWRAYSAVTTAEQVPQDLHSMSHMLADPGFWPWVFMALFLVLLGWSLWPQEEDAPSREGGTTVTTSGQNSPGVGSVGRDFHFHNHQAPAARQERKQAVSPGPPVPRMGASAPERAEFPIWRAIDHVRRVIGDEDSSEAFPDARKELRQYAAEGRIALRGRKEIPPAHMTAPQVGSSVWSEIDSDYWHDYEINRLASIERFDDREHTQLEAFPGKIGQRYWSLRVQEKVMKRLWQEPLRTTNDGKPDGQPVSAKPDMPLDGVLVRVYRYLGGAPEDSRAKPSFYRRVDLEIQDKIVEEGLHVWGRFGRRAREPLSAQSLKRGWLDHRQRTFFAPTIDSSPMEFTDIHFDKKEAERAWPIPPRTGK